MMEYKQVVKDAHHLAKHNTKLKGIVDALQDSNIALKIQIGKSHADNQANLERIVK